MQVAGQAERLKVIQRVFEIMRRASWHTFQVLTKRSARLAELAPEIDFPPNLWMGVSVENSDYYGRIDDLRKVPAHVRFLSLEPLLGPMPELDLTGIHWVIVGGESGPGFRPMKERWVKDIRDKCLETGVPFFFKQWHKQGTGRLLEGRTWDEFPKTAGESPPEGDRCDRLGENRKTSKKKSVLRKKKRRG